MHETFVPFVHRVSPLKSVKKLTLFITFHKKLSARGGTGWEKSGYLRISIIEKLKCMSKLPILFVFPLLLIKTKNVEILVAHKDLIDKITTLKYII